MWLRNTLLAGLFVLLPIAVIYLLAFQVWKLMRSKMYQLTEILGVSSELRFITALALLAVLMVLLLLIAGLVVRAGASLKGQRWLERILLRLLPGYGLMRMRLAERLGEKSPRTPGLLRTVIGLQPVLIMDFDGDRALVFLPNAPKGDSGTLLMVDPDRLERLDMSVMELDDQLHALGRGLLHKIPPSIRP